MTQSERSPGHLICHFFLTSKPYSYGCEISRAQLFYVALTRDVDFRSLSVVSVQALLAWLYFNWQSDRIQSDRGRIKPPDALMVVPALVVIGMGLAVGGGWGIVGAVAYFATVTLYAQKARSPLWGPWGPLLRVLTVLGQFAMVWGLAGGSPKRLDLLIAMSMAVWNGMRNLVGDVRDIQGDTYELPPRYGIGATLWVIRGAVVASVVCLGLSGVPFLGVHLAVAGASWIVLELVARHYPAKHAERWGYIVHRLLVIGTTALHLTLATALGMPLLWVGLSSALTLGLHPSYTYLPGKSFPTWDELRGSTTVREPGSHNKCI